MQQFKRFLPAIIFLVAFVYRLAGIGWGLPSAQHHQSYHPDEEVVWNYSQQLNPAGFDLTPGFYNYGTLYLTTLKIASDMVGVYGGHAAVPEGTPPSSPTLVDWEFVGRSHLAGRIISSIFGSLIPVFVFLILRRWTNELGASFGGLLAAFSPGLLVHSRFQTVDVMAAGLLVISSHFALRLILTDGETDAEGKGWKVLTPMKLAMLSGAFAGLSAGTKYTGFLAIFTLIAAAKLSKRPDWLKLSLAGFGTMMVAFVVATPGVLLESQAFVRDFKYEMLHTSTGHGLVFEKVGSGFFVHFSNLLQTLTPFALFLGVIGCLLLMGKAFGEKAEGEDSRTAIQKTFTPENAWLWSLAAFAIPYYILIGRAEVHFLRYTFPLVLCIACGFGWFIGMAHEKKGKWLIVPVIGIFALGGSLLVGAKFTGWMSGPEPRDQAAKYLAEKSQPNTAVGLVSDPWYYTPSFFPDSALSRMGVVDKGNPTLSFIYQMRIMQTLTNPAIVRYLPPDAKDRYDWDVRLLNEMKPDYVVYSSFESVDLMRLAGRKDLTGIPKLFVDRYNEFQTVLQRDYDAHIGFGERQATALAHDLMYIQPYIYVWKRKT